MFGFHRDLRFAIRALLKSPGFTLAVIAVLATGIAASTAVFTFANDILWRELPAQQPDELVRVYTGYTHGFQWGSTSYPVYEEFLEMDETFAGVIGESYQPMGLELDGSAHRIWGAVVTPDYFDFLSVRPAQGRFFSAAESAIKGQAPWVVVSERFWQRHLGSDPDVVGSRLEVNGFPLTVIGVAPRSFLGTQTGITPEVWVAVTMQPQVAPGPDWMESRAASTLWLIGRRAPGVSVESMRAALSARVQSLKSRYPDEHESLAEFNVLPEIEGGFHPFYRAPFAQFLGVLTIVVGIVLLVACSNTAGLLIARGTTRAREVAIRRAVGAGSWRVRRQLFTENLVLALAAGAIGVGIAALLVRLVSAFQPPTDIPLTFGFEINARVLAFTTLVSVATALLFGILPALRATRAELVDALRTRTGDDPGGSRMRSVVVAGQVALSMALLIGASLFLRSLGNVSDVDLGFEPAGIQLGSLDLAPRAYSVADGREFFRQLLERLENDPDVITAALGARQPFNLDPAPLRVAPDDFVPGPDGALPTVEFNGVSPGFFEVTGTEIVAGREFSTADGADTQRVVIVSEQLARNFWPDRPAIGRRLQISGRDWEVVGIAGDTKFRTLSGDVLPYFYVPLAQRFEAEVTVFARPRPGVDLEAVLRRHVGALDASVPIFGLKSLVEQVGVAMLPARMAAVLLSVFGALTLGLAAVGLYGVLAYSVELRRRELGVRMALGASVREVLGAAVGTGARLVGIGLAIGLGLGFGLSRLLAGMLHGVSPNDPASYIGTMAALGAVALMASWLPALRAARVDPAVILRDD